MTKHNKHMTAPASIEKLEDDLDILDAERILKDIQEGKEKVIKIKGSALDFLRKLN
jgi:Lhr-like helicase